MKNIQLKIKQQSITLKLVCAEIEDILICDREYASAFCVVNNNNYVVFFKDHNGNKFLGKSAIKYPQSTRVILKVTELPETATSSIVYD